MIEKVTLSFVLLDIYYVRWLIMRVIKSDTVVINLIKVLYISVLYTPFKDFWNKWLHTLTEKMKKYFLKYSKIGDESAATLIFAATLIIAPMVPYRASCHTLFTSQSSGSGSARIRSFSSDPDQKLKAMIRIFIKRFFFIITSLIGY
jgi:hypothetical protein